MYVLVLFLVIIFLYLKILHPALKKNKGKEKFLNIIPSSLFLMLSIFSFVVWSDIMPFISATESYTEVYPLVPITSNPQSNNGIVYLAGVHSNGENKVLFSYQGQSKIKIRLVPTNKISFREYDFRALSDKRDTKYSLPFVAVTKHHYKDTWANRYIFLNAGKRVYLFNDSSYKFVIPQDSYKTNYSLEIK